jgi:hypothetical protein
MNTTALVLSWISIAAGRASMHAVDNAEIYFLKESIYNHMNIDMHACVDVTELVGVEHIQGREGCQCT